MFPCGPTFFKAGAVLVPQFWNPADKSASLTLSNGDSLATSSSGSWSSVRSVTSHDSGFWYAEAGTVGDGGDAIFGVALAIATLGNYSGSDLNSWGVQFTSQGNYYHNGLSSSDIPTGGHYAIAINIDTGNCWFGAANNDGSLHFKTGADPSTGANPTFTVPPSTVLYMMGSAIFNGNGIQLFNTPATIFAASIPTGSRLWG